MKNFVFSSCATTGPTIVDIPCYNFELRCGASCIIKQRVSFVMVLTTRSVAVEGKHVFK